jgi:hypothetical protein
VLAIGIKPPRDGRVVVKAFNMAGELVRPVAEMDLVAGVTAQATWDGRNDGGEVVSAGIYFISIQGAGVKSVRKVVLLK